MYCQSVLVPRDREQNLVQDLEETLAEVQDDYNAGRGRCYYRLIISEKETSG